MLICIARAIPPRQPPERNLWSADHTLEACGPAFTTG